MVGDIRHKGMLMGIELVKDKKSKTPIKPKKSINKIFFDEGKKHGIYLRTLGNVIMLVPPLAISKEELIGMNLGYNSLQFSSCFPCKSWKSFASRDATKINGNKIENVLFIWFRKIK